jgi:hypothetical protein
VAKGPPKCQTDSIHSTGSTGGVPYAGRKLWPFWPYICW